jgi:hypothetical protein
LPDFVNYYPHYNAAMKIHTSFATMWVLIVLFLSLSSAAKVAVELKDAHGKSVGSALMFESDGMVIQLGLHARNRFPVQLLRKPIHQICMGGSSRDSR